MGEPNPSEREVYRFSAYRLDLASRRLTRSGEVVSLPPKAFELLQVLVRNADRAVTRTELLDAVWRDTIVEEGNLGWNMSVLRKALDDGDGRIIETVRGFGYRFGLPVERESVRPPETLQHLPALPSSAPAPAPSVDPPPESETGREAAAPGAGDLPLRPSPRRFRPGFAAVAVLAVLGAIAIRYGLRTRDESAAASPGGDFGGADARPALAVLPFENLSQKSEAVWLATALAEMLNGELATEGRARTTPGESVARVTAGLGGRAGSGLAATTLARLRRELGVDLVVVGNYLVLGEGGAGDNVRFDFRLQSAVDGRTLFAGSESGRVDDLFDIVARAGAALRSELPPGAGAGPASAVALASFRAPTEALRAYAEGVALRRQFQLGAARAKFEAAIAAAPDFVLAHAALADLLSELGYVNAARSESRRAVAGVGSLGATEKLAIQAKNRELEGRWAESAALWHELVRLDPGPIENGLALARALSHAGSHDEARATLDALARRPEPVGDDPRIEIERGWVERYAQDFGAMRAAGERALAVGRSLPSDYVALEALSLIAWADLSLGANETGLAACEEGQAIGERIGHNRLRTLHTSLCAWLEANEGRGDEAERDFRRAEELARADGNLIYEAGAVVALGWQRAGGGHLAEAADFAERALALGRSVGDHERELNSLELVSHVAYWRADLVRAEEASVEALAKSRELNISSRIALHLGALGRIRLERGDLAAALADHEEAVRILPTIAPDRIAAREIDLALTRLENGDAAGTIEICERIDARLADFPEEQYQRLLSASFRGRAGLRLGRREPALAAAELFSRHVAGVGDSTSGARTLAERAELLAALGETAKAAGAWRQLLADESFGEMKLLRLTAALRAAELDAALSPSGANKARLDEARREARAARIGRLLGERL